MDQKNRLECFVHLFLQWKKIGTFCFMTYFRQSILRLHSFMRQAKGIKREP